MNRKSLNLVVLATVGVSVLAMSYAQDSGTTSDQWQAPPRAARKKNPVPADDQSIAAGKALYQQECRACHGELGKGDGPSAKDLEKKPGDLSSPKMWDQTDGALFWKLTTGRKPMPTYEQKFSDDQRWSVVNYIRTLAPKPQGK
jgi:mono/diheme cytochrome c family protein